MISQYHWRHSGLVEVWMTTATLTCRRDRTPTALRCSKCDAPICPRCSVVTDVGQRCHACAKALPGPKIRRRWWPLVVAIAAIAVLTAVVLRAGNESQPAPAPLAGQGQQGTGFRTISRPDLGYAIDIPAGWLPAADNSATTTSYADSQSAIGSVRVTVGQDDAPLAEHVNGLVQALRAQGGTNFATKPGQISGLPSIEVDYRFPVVPGGRVNSSHSSFIVKRDTTVFSFQVATVDPVTERPILVQIEESIRLL
ncbi:MAG: hypothetical protein ACRDZ8_02520 [Acidimicrobiales bacterium]